MGLIENLTAKKATLFQASITLTFIGDRDAAVHEYAHGERLGSMAGWCIANLEQYYPDGNLVFAPDYLESIGFIQVKDDGQYGVWHNKAGYVGRYYGPMSAGKRIISFNRNGNWVTIKEDAATRTVFNGVIKSRDEFEIILNAIH